MLKFKTTIVIFLFFIGIASAQQLDKFKRPADDYRPWMLWNWVNTLVSKKGITYNLEQYKNFGARGTLVYLVGSETHDRQMWSNSNMPNPIVSQTPEFFAAWKFAAEESARLGLTISSQLGTGWCHSGGPLVKPEQAVQHLVFTETAVLQGGTKVNLNLGNTGGVSLGNAYHSKVLSIDQPTWIQIELPEVTKVEQVILHPYKNKEVVDFGFPKQFLVEVANKSDFSDAKLFYQTKGDFPRPNLEAVVLNGNVTGKYVRLKTIKNYTISRAGKDVYMLSLSKIDVLQHGINVSAHAKTTASSTIENATYSMKTITSDYNGTSYKRPGNKYILDRPGAQFFTGDVAVVAYPVKNNVQATEVIQLTKKFVNNNLTWTVPPGKWKIKRFAMRDAQAYTRPAPEGGRGLECDKLDKAAVDANFDAMVGRYLKESPQLVGKTIRGFQADSWEVGNPEWSPKFLQEFIKRRGYDPAPWIITYKTNQVIGNANLTQRFKNDMYLTQTDLFADNFFSHLAKKADSLGMEFMTEPYTAPFDPVRMAGRIQTPMCEFWVSGEMMYTARWASSSANTYGRKRVAAEAFTGRWNDGNWTMDPFAIKKIGDLAFCNGINKMVLHCSALQPWADQVKPGMSMYFWGTMFAPGQTWWEPGKAWINYLTRCQYLLSEGKNVADVVALMPTVEWWGSVPGGLHKKYNYDMVTEEL
ncbi:MAG: hypothetical protein EOO20_16010, partial [Chryseobacterium sp.]